MKTAAITTPACIARSSRNGRGRSAFTLIESALVMIIVGVGTVAVLQLLATGTMSNAESSELTTGLNLANDIREMSRGLSFADPTTPTNWGVETGESTVASYDDLDDLDGATFSPPVDARRQTLGTYTNWRQSITVETVKPTSITTATTRGSQRVNRISVGVFKSGLEICRISWLTVSTP